MLEQLLAGGSVRCRAGGRPLRARVWTRRGRPPDDDRALRRGSRRGGRRRCALRRGSWRFELGAHLLSADAARRSSTPGPALERAERVGDPDAASRWRSHGWASGDVGGRGHARLARARRGDRGASRARARVLTTSPSVSLARLLIRLGEIERARADLRGAGEEGGGTRRRGDARSDPLVAERDRVARRPLASGARPRDCSPGARRADAFPPTGAWVGRVKALVEADLGLVEEARAHAEEGIASAQALSHEIFIVSQSRRARPARARARQPRGRRPSTCASCRDGCSRAGCNDPAPPVWADAIETLIALGELELGPFLPGARTRRNADASGSPRAARAPPAAAACFSPPRATVRPRPPPSRRSLADAAPSRSSAAARCSAWAWCAGRRSRRRRRARRSSRRSRSSRSWARGCGRRRRARSSGGSAAALRRRTS